MNLLHSQATGIEDQASQAQALLFQKCRSFAPMIDFTEDEIATSVILRFEKQVEQYADHLAVKTPQVSLTYKDLNHAANQMGRAVIDLIGTNEEPVAYLLPHGAEQIIAILGIIKAGKMYLPLDPSFPKTRLTARLSDSQIRLLVTGEFNLGLAKDITKGNIHLIDLATLGFAHSVGNINLPIEPDRLISLLYTSGTAGRRLLDGAHPAYIVFLGHRTAKGAARHGAYGDHLPHPSGRRRDRILD